MGREIPVVRKQVTVEVSNVRTLIGSLSINNFKSETTSDHPKHFELCTAQSVTDCTYNILGAVSNVGRQKSVSDVGR